MIEVRSHTSQKSHKFQMFRWPLPTSMKVAKRSENSESLAHERISFNTGPTVQMTLFLAHAINEHVLPPRQSMHFMGLSAAILFRSFNHNKVHTSSQS